MSPLLPPRRRAAGVAPTAAAANDVVTPTAVTTIVAGAADATPATAATVAAGDAAAAAARNLGVIAHVDAGKTTTTERMLYYAGAVRAMGDVDDGSTAMDFLPAERERGITIASAATSFLWRSTRLTLIDTPGHVDFTVEVERSLRVMDGAVAVVDAVAGVQPQTATVWRQADAHGLPRVVYANKMDRPGACLGGVIASLRRRLARPTTPRGEGVGGSSRLDGGSGRGKNLVGWVPWVPLPVQLPLFRTPTGAVYALPPEEMRVSEDDRLAGVVDLVWGRTLVWDPADVTGSTVAATTLLAADGSGWVPGADRELLAAAGPARDALLASLADIDDRLCEAYLADGDRGIDGAAAGRPPALGAAGIDGGTVAAVLRAAVLARSAVPVLVGSSLRNVGVQPLLDAVVDYLPSPLERPPVWGVVESVGRGGGADGGSGGGGRPVRAAKAPKPRRPLAPPLPAIPVSTAGGRATDASSPSSRVSVALTGDAPLVALAFKVTHHPHRGRLVHVRIFGGAIPRRGAALRNSRTGTAEAPTALLRVRADVLDELPAAGVGEVLALSGLRGTATGDTLTSAHEGGGGGGRSAALLPVLDGVRAPPPVYSVALTPDGGGAAALAPALATLLAEDPSLSARSGGADGSGGGNDDGEAVVLAGQGELHLEIAVARLAALGAPRLRVSSPRVAWREGVTVGVERETIVYDRTIGGARLAAAVTLSVTPLRFGSDEEVGSPPPAGGDSAGVDGTTPVPDDRGNWVDVRVDGGSGSGGRGGNDGGVAWQLPADRREAIVAAAVGALERGPLLGAPLLGVGLTVHVAPPVLSSSGGGGGGRGGRGGGSGGGSVPGLGDPSLPLPALRSAVVAAVAAATAAAAPRVVEPFMEVVVDVPTGYLGDVVSALTDPVRRRGVVLGVDVEGDGGGGDDGDGSRGGRPAGGGGGLDNDTASISRAVLTARVPVEGLLGWATRLRSLSGGEGGFVAHFGGYEVCSAEERVVREERGF